MNIPSSKILYDKSDGLIIDDSRILKGYISLMREWGSHSITEPTGTEEVEELLCRFADKAADLRAKYEVEGNLLDAKTSLEVAFTDELNPLLDVFKFQLLKSIMDYFEDDESIDLMLDIMRRGNSEDED